MFDTTSINSALQALSYSFIPVLLGIILHEVAHGYVAYLKGDPTAKMLGRLTINPVPHIDPMGLVAFIITAIASPFVFGWAKPVPVDGRNLRNPKKDMIWIAAAGPLTNLVLAFVFGLLFKGLVLLLEINPNLLQYHTSIDFLVNMFQVGVLANIGLACINLVPIPPLDGSKIVMGFLPYKVAYRYASIERYGFMILILLLATGVLGMILMPFMQMILKAISTVLGI